MATLGTIVISISPTSGVVDETFTLSGTALDTTGAGIAVTGTILDDGAASGITWTSNSAGFFTTALSFTPAATYTIQATSGTVLSNILTIPVAPSYSITVYSLDQNGNDIYGYQVNLYAGASTSAPLVATMYTQAIFSNLPAGQYAIETLNTNNQGGRCTFNQYSDGETSNVTVGTLSAASGDGSVIAQFSCGAVSPPPSPVSPPPVSPSSPPGTFTLTVYSIDIATGNDVAGYQVNLYSGAAVAGTPIQTGFSPLVFSNLAAGTYTTEILNVNNQGGTCAFVQWSDGETTNYTVGTLSTASGDGSVIAEFSCTAASPPPPVSSPPPVSPPPPGIVLSSISINASSLTPLVGQAVTILGTATGSNGVAFSGAVGTLTDDGTTVANSTWTSSATGTFSEPVTFASAGTYTVQAVSGSILSNVITITASATTSPPPPASPSVLTAIDVATSVNPASVNSTVQYSISAFDQADAPYVSGVNGIITVLGIGSQAFTIPSGTNAVVVGFVMTGMGTFPVTATSGNVTSAAINQIVSAAAPSGGLNNTDLLITGGVAAVGIAVIAVVATNGKRRKKT